MEGMNVAMASGWMRSLKLNDAADMCIAHGIDGFVLLALLELEGGLESIGITKCSGEGESARWYQENDDGGGLHKKDQCGGDGS